MTAFSGMQGTSHSAVPALVLRPAELRSIERGGGTRTTPLVTDDVGATSFLTGITNIRPGAAVPRHTHNCTESVLVIDGEAVVEIDGIETELRRFDATLVPANVPHRFRNPSERADLAIFWTYASVDATRTATDTGVTARIDEEQQQGRRGSRVTEVTRFHVVAGRTAAFEAEVAAARDLFQRAPGCRSFDLARALDDPASYTLSVLWSDPEQAVRFRSSPESERWLASVTPHLTLPPSTEQSQPVLKGF